MESKTKFGKKYSHNTYTSITTPFNEYMWFLISEEYISQDDFFTIDIGMTLEQKKQARRRGEDVAGVRTRDTYTIDDLVEIKKKIDVTYKANLEMRIRAYAIYFGVCTGLRRGNLLGLTTACLHPNSDIPYFDVKDNIVAVTTFLKENLKSEVRLLSCYPDTLVKWWRQIAKECSFKFLHPHAWKHSYATIGALHIHDWYQGSPYLLQKCCLHSSFRTTEKYINQVSDQFLKAFKKQL